METRCTSTGPRRSLADRFTAEAVDGGKLSTLGDIPMYTYGTFVVPDFDAGSQVYELVSPDGIVSVMPSTSLMVDPDNTVGRLPTLGQRLGLPEGWQIRARTLEKELVMPVGHDDDPPNTMVLDEFENKFQRVRTL